MYAVWLFEKHNYPSNGDWLRCQENKIKYFPSLNSAKTAAMDYYKYPFDQIEQYVKIEWIVPDFEKEDLLALLKTLTKEERQELLSNFCCSCNVFIGSKKSYPDKQNYCSDCVPDYRED